MDRSRSRRVGRNLIVGLARSGGAFRLILALACLGGSWSFDRPAMAQGALSGSRFYPNDSEDAERLLRNAANQARDRQWKEAIDLYQRVIERFGDKVARVPRQEPGADVADFVLFMDGRKYCHRRISQMPPEARALYRGRVDSMARRWYEEGARDRDPRLLRRVVGEAFCSSWGDEALELLGDLAFQDGRFGEAMAAYGQLVPDRPEDPFALVHPDPTVDLARIAAKKWLCRAAEDRPPTAAEVASFAGRYPGATGTLAGRDGPYAKAITEAVADDRLAMVGQPDGRWPTFGGSPRRTRVVPGPIDVGQVQWRVELEKVSAGRANPMGMRIPSSVSHARPSSLLAYHPIVLGDQVVICDGSKVVAYNLGDRPADAETGEPRPVVPAWRHDPDGPAVVQVAKPPSSIPRYTLTAVGRRIYARMGTTGWMSPTGGRRGGFGVEPGNSSIVALDWDTQGKLLWEVRSVNLELPHRQGGRMATVNFEGTPVADARNVYAAVTDHGQQTMVYVACFDAETGDRKWIRYLGTATPELDQFQNGFAMPMFGGPPPGDYRHRLLSLDGSTLYYQTNLGAVIALDAETGGTHWVATYPRQETKQFGQLGDRDLNPAVVDEGRVMVAPEDSDAIYAFDAGSGRLVWKTEPIADDVKLAHVLGVAKGRLVVTGDRVLLFDVKDGKFAAAWPDSATKMEGFGRGLLAGDRIYWPTQNEIQVLDQRTGLKAGPPIKLGETYHIQGGNLAAGDGYLIVAQSDGLAVFCQNSRLIDRYSREIVAAPGRAANYYRLARAAEAIGRDPMAMASYREAIERARADETIDGISLASAARDHLFRMLIRGASKLRRDRKWAEAVAQLESAAGAARTDTDRLEARLLLAEVHLDASRPREAVDALESILLDGRLRPLPVAADEGRRTIRADLLVSDRLASIVRDHGRGAYAEFDRRASALLERGRKERDPDLLEEVGREYPAARAVPEALWELGALEESADRLAGATRAYRRLASSAVDDEGKARALWALARVYDARKLHVPARDAYLELTARYPGLRPEAKGATYADRVERELASPPYPRLLAGRRRSSPPMFRRWHWAAPTDRGVRALTTEGSVPSLEASRIVLGEGDSLRMLDASDGSTSWCTRLGSPARWAGYLDDKLIVGGAGQVVALDLATGAVQWRYRPDSGHEGSGGRPDPFAVGEAAASAGGVHREVLGEFRLVKRRVFCLRGALELVALDGDTGAVDWSFAPALGSGPINPLIWVGPDRVVLHVEKPNQLLVLRTDDGRPVARRPLGESEHLERPALPLDDDSALVVLDARTVKKLDLNTGQFSWEYRESERLPVNGPPCLLGGGGLVLVLHEGRTLIRLDPATGSKRWSSLLGLEDMSRRLAAMAFDDVRFYCISRFGTVVTLRAVDLDTGDRAWTGEWTTTAEDSTWSLSLAADHVIAYPLPPAPGRGVDMESVPVIVRRRDTGGLVQRLVFPAGVAKAAVATRPDRPSGETDPAEGAEAVTFNPDQLGAVVATPRGLWGLGPRIKN